MGYVYDGFTDAVDIPRDHIEQKRAKGFISDRKRLEDYDDIENVKRAFKKWLNKYYTNPKVAQCHGSRENEKVYFKLTNRFIAPMRNIRHLSNALNNYKGKGVFLTLTYSHDIPLKDAWQNIAKDWNRFLTRMKIELKNSGTAGTLHYIRVIEAQENGYPHIHALFLGIDYLYNAGNKVEWDNDNPHSKNIKHFWNRGSVFINRTKSGEKIRNSINYAMKYIRKTWTDDNEKSELTKAMLWAFNKRSWDTSRGLMEFLNAQPKPKSDLKLDGIHKFSIPHGQRTPILRLIRKPKHISINDENVEIHNDCIIIHNNKPIIHNPQRINSQKPRLIYDKYEGVIVDV